MQKYLIPISIIVGAIILGGFYYLATQGDAGGIDDTSKNNSSLDVNSALTTYNIHKPLLPPHQLYCIPERKVSCSIDGCDDVVPSVFVLINEDKSNYSISRCDDKPCDTYEATPYFSGAYLEVKTNDNHGLLFKTSIIDQSYVEVVTLGTDTLTSHGRCYKND
jgi:hypothetical protein